MKLYTALKLKKKLVGEITKLKTQIQAKNSYIMGDTNANKYDVGALETILNQKITELVELKLSINKANLVIQSDIYHLAEIKGLLLFWQSVNTSEGIQESPYSDKITTRVVHFDELATEQRQKELQEKVDAIQEKIDSYNYTTDI